MNNKFDNNVSSRNKRRNFIIFLLLIIVGIILIVSGITIQLFNTFDNNSNSNQNNGINNNTNIQDNTLKITLFTMETPRYEVSYPNSWNLYNGSQYMDSFKVDYNFPYTPDYVLVKDNVRLEFFVLAGHMEEVNTTNCDDATYGYIQNIKVYKLTDDTVLYSTMNTVDNVIYLTTSVGHKSMYNYIKDSKGIDDNGYVIGDEPAKYCRNGNGLNYHEPVTTFGNYVMIINVVFTDYDTDYYRNRSTQKIKDKTIDVIRKELDNNASFQEAIEILKTIKEVIE